jgi:hypothetical protein
MIILEYRTGWDYKISNNKIEAHAPSYVKIKSFKTANISITPKIRDGGSAKAIATVIVNGKSDILLYDHKINFMVDKNDIIELSFTLEDEDKNGCWNYWIIEGDKLNDQLPTIYMNKHSRLGDSISFLVGLENLCRENNIQGRVCNKQIYADIIKCFGFKYVQFIDSTNDAICLDHVFGSSSWDEFWLERIRNSLSDYFGLSNTYSKIVIPYCKIKNTGPNGDFICVQLDSRSAANMDIHLSRRFIKRLSENYDVKILGGIDSKRYLGDGFDYSFGDIEHEIKELIRCKFFVGVDSGIAHLAGLLGVKSFIINLIEQRTIINLFGKYENMEFITPNMVKKLI